MITDFMNEKRLSELLEKKRTAMCGLKKEHVFPETILTHPAQYSQQAVEKWLNAGGVNQAV
ncbi:DNA-binding protein [Citrobacter sp. BDA59-3]|nr:DNA-binding protein [Citrobacter sp. BDA59-3]QOV71339.1 DNA-binding protein [Citrobacter sp. BDA59-3]